MYKEGMCVCACVCVHGVYHSLSEIALSQIMPQHLDGIIALKHSLTNSW